MKRNVALVAVLFAAFAALGAVTQVNLATQAFGILPAASFPALTGQVTTSAGSLTTSVRWQLPALSNATSDVFQRSGSGLGTNWTAYTNNFNPNSGSARGTAAVSSNGYNVDAYTGVSSVPTQTVKVIIGSLNGTTDLIGAAVRIGGTAGSTVSAYLCAEESTGLYLVKMVGATPTSGGTTTTLASTSITGAAGDQISLQVVGNTLTCRRNVQTGSEQDLQYNDSSSPLTSGYPGLFQLGDTATITAFTFTNPAPASSCNVNIVADGDSITRGYEVLAPYTESLLVTNGSVPCVGNVGVIGKALGITESTGGGTSVESMITTGTSVVDTLYQSGMDNIVVLWGGTNDLQSGQTPSEVYSNIQTYITNRHTAGWKVVLIPVLSLDSYDQQAQALDQLIAAGGTGADAVVSLPQALAGPGAYANTTLFISPGIHPTQLSDSALIAPAIAAAVDSLH